MKKHQIMICVGLYALIVSLALAWSIARTKHIYVLAPGAAERSGVQRAVAATLAAAKDQKLLRGDVHKLVAVRDKNKQGWSVTLLFEDPPIIGGDVIATVHPNGEVTVMPGF